MKNEPEILSQSEVNELAITLEILAESGQFDVIGTAELAQTEQEYNQR